jgi:hypothetical protein
MRFHRLIAMALLVAAAAVPARAQTDEDAAWQILKETGTADQLRRFIAQSPDGPHRGEAEDRLKVLERKQAVSPPNINPAKPAWSPNPKHRGAILYEEDPANSQGVSFPGSAVWRTERMEAPAGSKPGVAIVAGVNIPERNIAVRLSIRRNSDPSLSASHTVEVKFALPIGFRHGGLASVPGILMKTDEMVRGTALKGLGVKVTDNYFMVGLSSDDAIMTTNVRLLKERPWIDIAVVYSDGKRAIVSVEKGASGARAFAAAFAAWEEEGHAGP